MNDVVTVGEARSHSDNSQRADYRSPTTHSSTTTFQSTPLDSITKKNWRGSFAN